MGTPGSKSQLNTLLNRVDRCLAACAAAAGASLAVVPSSDAAIVYSGIVNINVPSTTAGIYINLLTGVFATSPGAVPGWDINPWGSTAFNFWANNAASPNDGVINNFPGGTSATLVDNLPLGSTVNGAFTFGRTNGIETTGPTAFVLNCTSNYVGFRFLNEATGQINFGWAQFGLSTTPGSQPRTLISYAYDNSGAPIAVGLLTPPPPTPTQVVSRKSHNGVLFDVNLPLTGTGPVGIECRSGRAINDYEMVFSFASPVTFNNAAVTAGTGTIKNASGSGTTAVTVDLANVNNAQRITVTLSSVTDCSGVTGNVSVQMGVLVGDTNGDGFVNAGDALQTRNRSGQATDATNFRSDVNTDGFVNSGDATVVRTRSGTFLP